MRPDPATKHYFAERFANVLRRFEHEGGAIEVLARSVGETPRSLKRWANGDTMPGHVLCALLGELPRHLADELIRPTGLRLIATDHDDHANTLLAAASAAAFAGEIARRHGDGQFCHRDRAVVRAEAQRLIAELEPLAAD